MYHILLQEQSSSCSSSPRISIFIKHDCSLKFIASMFSYYLWILSETSFDDQIVCVFLFQSISHNPLFLCVIVFDFVFNSLSFSLSLSIYDSGIARSGSCTNLSKDTPVAQLDVSHKLIFMLYRNLASIIVMLDLELKFEPLKLNYYVLEMEKMDTSKIRGHGAQKTIKLGGVFLQPFKTHLSSSLFFPLIFLYRSRHHPLHVPLVFIIGTKIERVITNIFIQLCLAFQTFERNICILGKNHVSWIYLSL